MITSIVNKENEKKYPYLGVSHTGAIVLFTSDGTGTRLKEGTHYDAQEIGEFSEAWEESNFTKLNGSITLKNE